MREQNEIGKEHVDYWLDYPTDIEDTKENKDNIKYAKFVLELMRFPSFKQFDYKQFTQQFELYCTWNTIRYKVTFASRLGWIGLKSLKCSDPNQTYTEQATWSHCSNWSANP